MDDPGERSPDRGGRVVNEFRVDMTTHGDECDRCVDAVAAAISHARVTGSVGATWTDDRPSGICRAKVSRIVTVPA